MKATAFYNLALEVTDHYYYQVGHVGQTWCDVGGLNGLGNQRGSVGGHCQAGSRVG